MIDDSLGMGGGVWWGSVVVQNLPSERKLPMGKVQKKVKKKTNNSAFSATHTYIKLTLVSFFLLFFLCTFPLLKKMTQDRISSKWDKQD